MEENKDLKNENVEVKIDEDKISNNVFEKMKAFFKGGDNIEEKLVNHDISDVKKIQEEFEKVKTETLKLQQELDALNKAKSLEQKLNSLNLVDEKYKKVALAEIEEKGITEEEFIANNPQLKKIERHIDKKESSNVVNGTHLSEQQYKILKGILPKGSL